VLYQLTVGSFYLSHSGADSVKLADKLYSPHNACALGTACTVARLISGSYELPYSVENLSHCIKRTQFCVLHTIERHQNNKQNLMLAVHLLEADKSMLSASTTKVFCKTFTLVTRVHLLL